MINYISKSSINNVVIIPAILIIICMTFSGCSIIERTSEYVSKSKIQCTVNEENGTQIVYDDVTFQILEEQVDKSELGGWRGVLKNIALLDENYKVIKQIKMKADPFSQLKDIIKNSSDNVKYVVPFYNVFTIKGVDDDKAIVVHLFSGFYKAIPIQSVLKDSKSIKYDKETQIKIVNELNR